MKFQFLHKDYLYMTNIMNKKLDTSWSYVLNINNMDNAFKDFNMFENANLFNQNLTSWDVSNVTNMNDMFLQCSTFNDIYEPSSKRQRFVEDLEYEPPSQPQQCFTEDLEYEQPQYDSNLQLATLDTFNDSANGTVDAPQLNNANILIVHTYNYDDLLKFIFYGCGPYAKFSN